MVVNAFQQANDPIALESRAIDVVEEVFKVADGLQGGNEGERNGEVKAPSDSEG
jgi:hypothetical protein